MAILMKDAIAKRRLPAAAAAQGTRTTTASAVSPVPKPVPEVDEHPPVTAQVVIPNNSIAPNLFTEIAKFRRCFDTFRRSWLISPFRLNVLHLLTTHPDFQHIFRPAVDRPMLSAVCVGLGSLEHHTYNFTNNTGTHHHEYRSWRQLCLFLDVLSLLNLHINIGVMAPAVYDPKLTFADKAILHSLGMRILDSETEAKSAITSSTFLFAPFLNWCPLLQVYLAGDQPPGFFIGNALHRLGKPQMEHYAKAEGEEEETSIEMRAKAMATSRDRFLKGRSAVGLHRYSAVGEDDVPGIVGLFAFADGRDFVA